eukprot:9677-Heterococcus_DN1.PRE.2
MASTSTKFAHTQCTQSGSIRSHDLHEATRLTTSSSVVVSTQDFPTVHAASCLLDRVRSNFSSAICATLARARVLYCFAERHGVWSAHTLWPGSHQSTTAATAM